MSKNKALESFKKNCEIIGYLNEQMLRREHWSFRKRVYEKFETDPVNNIQPKPINSLILEYYDDCLEYRNDFVKFRVFHGVSNNAYKIEIITLPEPEPKEDPYEPTPEITYPQYNILDSWEKKLVNIVDSDQLRKLSDIIKQEYKLVIVSIDKLKNRVLTQLKDQIVSKTSVDLNYIKESIYSSTIVKAGNSSLIKEQIKKLNSITDADAESQLDYINHVFDIRDLVKYPDNKYDPTSNLTHCFTEYLSILNGRLILIRELSADFSPSFIANHNVRNEKTCFTLNYNGFSEEHIPEEITDMLYKVLLR